MSEAVVAELVDALGSGSSVHWTWEFESPLLGLTILRKSISTQTPENTILPKFLNFPQNSKQLPKQLPKYKYHIKLQK